MGLVARSSQAEAGGVSDAPSCGHSCLLWQRGEPVFTESLQEVGVQLVSLTLQSLLLSNRSSWDMVQRTVYMEPLAHPQPSWADFQKASFAR